MNDGNLVGALPEAIATRIVSAKLAQGVATLVVDVAGLAPTGRISPGQPVKVSAPAPPALTRAQPEVWRPIPPYGRRQVSEKGEIDG